MTTDEVASSPEARLGGALLWMVVAAATLCVLAAAGALFAVQQIRELGGRYIVAVAFVGTWSVLFIAMTALHSRATPVAASAGLLAWIAYRFAVAIMSQAGWPLAVDLLGEALLAAGFCGYMAEGVRPNAYYRRRLRLR